MYCTIARKILSTNQLPWDELLLTTVHITLLSVVLIVSALDWYERVNISPFLKSKQKPDHPLWSRYLSLLSSCSFTLVPPLYCLSLLPLSTRSSSSEVGSSFFYFFFSYYSSSTSSFLFIRLIIIFFLIFVFLFLLHFSLLFFILLLMIIIIISILSLTTVLQRRELFRDITGSIQQPFNLP